MKTKFVAVALLEGRAADQRPNIMFILTDDQSWSTLGCYGGRIVPTPNLDRLATEGARFTDEGGFVGSDSEFGIGKSTSAREDEKGRDCLHGQVGLPAEAPRSSADAASPGRCRAAAVC